MSMDLTPFDHTIRAATQNRASVRWVGYFFGIALIVIGALDFSIGWPLVVAGVVLVELAMFSTIRRVKQRRRYARLAE